MRGPGGLSRPIDPTSIWPCKHGEISVPLAARCRVPREHMHHRYFRPSATAAPPPRSRPAAHPSPTPAAPLPCPEPAAATRAAAASYTHMHSHTHTLHAHNTHDHTPPCCFITTSGRDEAAGVRGGAPGQERHGPPTPCARRVTSDPPPTLRTRSYTRLRKGGERRSGRGLRGPPCCPAAAPAPAPSGSGPVFVGGVKGAASAATSGR